MNSHLMCTPTNVVWTSGCTSCHHRQFRGSKTIQINKQTQIHGKNENDFLGIADKEMEDELPPHAYTNNYGPDFRLHIPVRTGKENLNSPERIAKLRNELLQNISR